MTIASDSSRPVSFIRRVFGGWRGPARHVPLTAKPHKSLASALSSAELGEAGGNFTNDSVALSDALNREQVVPLEDTISRLTGPKTTLRFRVEEQDPEPTPEEPKQALPDKAPTITIVDEPDIEEQALADADTVVPSEPWTMPPWLVAKRRSRRWTALTQTFAWLGTVGFTASVIGVAAMWLVAQRPIAGPKLLQPPQVVVGEAEPGSDPMPADMDQ